MNYALNITLMVVCLLFSAFFSASETAFTSTNRVKIKTLASDGNKRAKRVEKIIDKYDKMLSAVLIGNNIVNITLSTISTLVFVAGLSGKIGEDMAATVSTIVTTVIVLIFGEVMPKTIAKEFPESFAMTVAPIVNLLMIIFTPFCAFFSLIRKGLNKIFKPKNKNSFTEDEILTIVDEAESGGGIKEEEGQLIRSAIEFIDCTAGEILTPRVDVVAAPITISSSDLAKLIADSGFSRIPIYEGTVDNIVGIIHEKDFYSSIFNTDKNIREIMKPPVFTVESIKISELLKLLQKNKMHLAIVTDEFGGTQGIVTLEDIIEELVGEIWDETDELEENYIQISDTQYSVRGDAEIDILHDLFDIDTDEFDATTIGGFINELSGKMPREGATVTYKNIELTVMKVSRRRIIEVRLDVLPESDENDEEDDSILKNFKINKSGN